MEREHNARMFACLDLGTFLFVWQNVIIKDSFNIRRPSRLKGRNGTRSFIRKLFFWIFVQNKLTNELGYSRVLFLTFVIVILTWSNLTGFIIPFWPCFHPQRRPISAIFFLNLKKGHKKEGSPVIDFFIGFLTWPDLTGVSLLLNPPTPPWGWGWGREGGVKTNF